MKKTGFFVVLAVLALGFVIVPAEAKIDTTKQSDGSYLIVETPDIPIIKTIIPPLPPEINLSPKEIEQVYLLTKTGQTYRHDKEMSTIKSVLPPTFKKVVYFYEVSLMKDETGSLGWQTKETFKKEEAPVVNSVVAAFLVIMMLLTFMVTLHDRLGKRKTFILLIFYFFSLLPSGLWLVVEREAISAGMIHALNSMTPFAAWFFLALLLPKIKNAVTFILSIFTAVYVMASISLYFVILRPGRIIEAIVYSELFSLLIATIIISLIIGEGWYYWKNRRTNINVALQPN